MKIDDPPDNLEYQITLSDDGSYLRLTYLADITDEITERTHVEMSRQVEKTGVLKHLVDSTRVRDVQNATHMYMFVTKKLSASPFVRNFKIAIVTHPDDKSHNFIETLFRNNCIRGRLFNNEDEALAWLKE